MNTAFLFSLGNLSNSLPAIFLGKQHIPSKAKQRLQQAQRSLGIYPPAYTKFPEESLLVRLTTHENSRSMALQLGGGKGKSAQASSDTQCTHILCSGITILLRVKNFIAVWLHPKKPSCEHHLLIWTRLTTFLQLSFYIELSHTGIIKTEQLLLLA